MPRLHWTPKAYGDLDEIQRYISQDDPEAAVQVLLRILEGAEQLAEFPESGPIMREKRWEKDMLRYLTVGSYSLFYRIDECYVSVIRVLHTARDYNDIL